MRLILIDPKARAITELDLSDYTDWYAAMDCELFTPAGPNLMVDDEGLFKDEQAFFSFAHYHPHYPLAGKAILTGGADEEGETLPCKLSVEEVENLVTWRTPQYANQYSQAGGFDGGITTIENGEPVTEVMPFRPNFKE